MQRALSEFGYGQIKPTGTLDPDTQRAIAEFERPAQPAHHWPTLRGVYSGAQRSNGAHAAVMCYCSTEMKGARAAVIANFSAHDHIPTHPSVPCASWTTNTDRAYSLENGVDVVGVMSPNRTATGRHGYFWNGRLGARRRSAYLQPNAALA